MSELVPFAVTLLQDGLSLLGIPTATSTKIFSIFMKKNAEKALDILLTQLSQCQISDIEAAEENEITSVIYRYALAIRDNIARRNLHLLAQVMKGMIQRRSLFSDDFNRYAVALSNLSREEIIVIGALHRCKLGKSRELNQENPNINKYWSEFVEQLVPSIYQSERHVMAVVCGALRSGLIVSGNTFDDGDLYSTSPFMDEVFDLIDFEEALRDCG